MRVRDVSLHAPHPEDPIMKRLSLPGLSVLLLSASGSAFAGDLGERIDRRS